MSDLQTLIKRISIDPVHNESFVYYDIDNGKISKVSSKNIYTEGLSILPVPSEEIQPILTGEKKTEDFIVTYDVSLKQMRVKEITYDDTHNSAATMTYKLPVIMQSHDAHFTLKRIYEGTNIFVWDKTKRYKTNDHIYYNTSIYKINKDIEHNTDFNTDEHQEIKTDVVLTTIPTQTHSIEIPVYTSQYAGINVDVWYDNLSHLGGQHVWYQNSVYKILKDQDADTKFTLDNAALLVSDVKLFEDENIHLKFDTNLYPGDIILKNNKLYSISFEKTEIEKDKSLVFFYNSKNTKITYDPNNNEYEETDLNKDSKEKTKNDISLDLVKTEDLLNGQIVLCGMNLFIVEVSRDYDIIIQQNTVSKYWNIQVNPYTKRFLRTSGYRPSENLYFSITAKHDPNLLIRSLEFKISDLLTEMNPVIPFKYESEADPNDVSIFTAKYFDSYAHEVL